MKRWPALRSMSATRGHQRSPRLLPREEGVDLDESGLPRLPQLRVGVGEEPWAEKLAGRFRPNLGEQKRALEDPWENRDLSGK